ncbi:MAG: hypothetical protein QXN44_05935 [Candidatus Caldarchaeum sp.]
MGRFGWRLPSDVPRFNPSSPTVVEGERVCGHIQPVVKLAVVGPVDADVAQGFPQTSHKK